MGFLYGHRKSRAHDQGVPVKQYGKPGADERNPIDGFLMAGWRLVSKAGTVRFAGGKWASSALLNHQGQYIYLEHDGLWGVENLSARPNGPGTSLQIPLTEID